MNALDHRERIYARTAGLCFYCGARPNVKTVDHFIPISAGGSDDIENLVLACYPCNNAKDSMMPEEYFEMVGIPIRRLPPVISKTNKPNYYEISPEVKDACEQLFELAGV